MTIGHLLVAASVLFFLVAGHSVLFSVWLDIPFLDILARDTHYKYLLLLGIPTTAYFVIANWVGWQYYRNS